MGGWGAEETAGVKQIVSLRGGDRRAHSVSFIERGGGGWEEGGGGKPGGGRGRGLQGRRGGAAATSLLTTATMRRSSMSDFKTSLRKELQGGE